MEFAMRGHDESSPRRSILYVKPMSPYIKSISDARELFLNSKIEDRRSRGELINATYL